MVTVGADGGRQGQDPVKLLVPVLLKDVLVWFQFSGGFDQTVKIVTWVRRDR